MTTSTLVLRPLKASPQPSRSACVEIPALIHLATHTQKRPLRELMTWLIDQRTLAAAWQLVSQADGAATPGPDGLTCAQLHHRVGPWLSRLADDLLHQRYRPAPPRWVHIPKPSQPDRFRRIGILNLRDRVVQAALKLILEPIFEPIFLHTSFGFRPGRSVAAALQVATQALSASHQTTPSFPWAAPWDIADCFPSLDHLLLKSLLRRHIADQPLLSLLDQIIETSGTWQGTLWWKRRCGIVQGGALSPLLCNLALHELDVAAQHLQRRTHGGILLLRYADDLLLLARTPALGRQALHEFRRVLGQLHLRWKTKPRLQRALAGIDWLGVTLVPRKFSRPGSIEFGYEIPAAKLQNMIDRLIAMTQPPNDRIDAATFNLGRWIVSLNQQLRDWRQAYLFADNAFAAFRLLDDLAHRRVEDLLYALTGLSRRELRKQHLVRLPRGFVTWEYDGVRLTVLSSLAPHTPDRLIRKPRWWSPTPFMRTNPEGRQTLPAEPAPTLPLTLANPEPQLDSQHAEASPPPPDPEPLQPPSPTRPSSQNAQASPRLSVSSLACLPPVW